MKHFLLILLSFLTFVRLDAAEPFFCVTEGAQFHYERTYADNGRLKWSHMMTINEVDSTAEGGYEVFFSSLFCKANSSPMYGGKLDFHSSVSPNGEVNTDLAATFKSVFKKMLSISEVASDGGTVVLPSVLNPGDNLPDAHAEVTALGMRYAVDVTERKVLRLERLETDAGSFDCMVISEHKVERGFGRNRVTTALTWYARGIGMVRHDTFDRRGRLDTSETLVRYSF